jgi:hypothetical protein
MHPVEEPYPGTEREWDSFSIVRSDFRGPWNGDLVNLFTLVQPARTVSETAELVVQCARQIAGWVFANRERFGAHDRFQIVVGWPLSVRKTHRQIVKTGGTYEDIEGISSQRCAVPLRDGWSTGIFNDVI